VIGFLDWTAGKISLFVFDRKGGHFSLVETGTISVEGDIEEADLASLVRTDIEHFYLSVPANILSLRELTFPFSDRNKIKDTLPYELEGVLYGNTGDYSIDHHIMESSESSSQVLAACMEKTRLKHIIDQFTSAGIEPEVITSIDLNLSHGEIDKLLDKPETDENIRAEAARGEIADPIINLRQGDLAYKGNIERIRKSLRYTSVLVLVLLLIISSGSAIRLSSVKNENKRITRMISATYQRSFPDDKKIVDPIRQFKGNMNRLRSKKNIFIGIPVLDIMRSITEYQDKEIELSELSVERHKILIKGSAFSFENVDRLKNSLESVFSDVSVTDSESSPDKKIIFSISMRAYDS
jgi:type II secretory pathway component PulL